MTMNPLRVACVATLMAVLGLPVLAAPGAHEHGVARLSVAVDGRTLSLEFDAPLDGLLGFERPPRIDAERKAAADLLQRLRDPAALFRPDAAAGCSAGAATVSAPVLEPGAKAGGEHADVELQFSFTCSAPQALRTLDVGLFDAFRRLQRVDVQLAGARLQSRHTLKRPARSLPLVR